MDGRMGGNGEGEVCKHRFISGENRIFPHSHTSPALDPRTPKALFPCPRFLYRILEVVCWVPRPSTDVEGPVRRQHRRAIESGMQTRRQDRLP